MSSEPTNNNSLDKIHNLLWGQSTKQDVFRRWCQGFEFSQYEPTALVQWEGGPCAVIAPVQAFILKFLLEESSQEQSFANFTPDKCKNLLINALSRILVKCSDKEQYNILTLSKATTQTTSEIDDVAAGSSSTGITTTTTTTTTITTTGSSKQCQNMSIEGLDQIDASLTVGESSSIEMTNSKEQKIRKKDILDSDEFLKRTVVLSMNSIEQVRTYYTDNYSELDGNYGIVLFLYSTMLTKTVENILNELSDTSEPIIHSVYGHASQALINLMLTGVAVPNVFDNVKDVGGLELIGISAQSDVGFLTLMEQLQYLTVGSFYKNPKNPVWVMGSDTHLTVLFSYETRLVSSETPCEVARRIFKSYDPDGNNFISSLSLQNVLSALDLVSEPEYVDIMVKKLDPESLGIILLNNFMYEFFPEELRAIPDTFNLIHYNGIPGSNSENKVKYNTGTAILLESDLKSMYNSENSMLSCLQTKWPNIEINWMDSKRSPSLN